MNRTPKETAVFLRRCSNKICDDSCPWCDVPVDCEEQMMRDAAEVLEEVPSWIGVDERRPDRELEEFRAKYGEPEPFYVLAVIEGASLSAALIYDGEGFKDEYGEPYRVVKWMPMPGV